MFNPNDETNDYETMQYSYQWANPEQSALIRTDKNGNRDYIPTAKHNRDYAEFLELVENNKVVAAAFVEPESPIATVENT